MDLVTWPLVWTPSTTKPALHLEWLRAPEQTQIFKFTDATPNSDWSAPSAYGNIILKNRTNAMVQVDPMEVRVNECSTSTKLKEVRVLVKSKDASPLYINFPGANVSVSILQKADTTITPNVSSTLANIPFASNTSIDKDAVCDWKTLTINTAAEKLKDILNVGQEAICPGTVYLNAGKVSSIENCFTGQYTPGSVIPDVRINLSALNTSYSFYTGFPLKKESVLTAINNLPILNATPASGRFQMLNSVAMTAGVVAINGINVPVGTSAANVANKINASPNFNTWLSANGWDTTVELTAKKPGILGNRITLTTTDSTNFPVSGATLTGGKGASGSSDGSLPILDIGIDTALGAAVGDTAWMPMDEDIQKAVEEKNGLWAFNWHPISVKGGSVTVEYQIYDIIESKPIAVAGQYIPTEYVTTADKLCIEIECVAINTTLTRKDTCIMSAPSTGMWLLSGAWGVGLYTWGWTTYTFGDITLRNIWRFTPTYVEYGLTHTDVVNGAGSTTFAPLSVGRSDYGGNRGKITNLRYFSRTDENGNRIGIRIGKMIDDVIKWEANMLPCKRVSDGMPGLYDTMRTSSNGTHFFPAAAADAFTCYYENETN